MESTLSAAISGQKSIEFVYPPGARIIEPHALGYSAEGNLLLRAYQVRGASASGEHQYWKLFRVDHATSLELLDETFQGPRPGYKRDDKAMKGGIIAQL